MIVIVDANLLISAVLNPEGTVAKLLILNDLDVEFVVPEYAWTEIQSHKNRICIANNIPFVYFDKLLTKLISFFLIFSEREVSTETIEKAFVLTSDIDKKDAIYVAFSLTLDALLWTGDLKLYRGLRRKGFKNVVTTKEMEQIIKGL